MTANIIPTAEPFCFQGDSVGCLLIHGFTGAPKEMRWMGEYLARQGFSVLGLRLAGHAILPQVTAPALMIHSKRDTSIPVEDMHKIYQRPGSKDKQPLLVENSGHVIPRDPERERVFEAAVEFNKKLV